MHANWISADVNNPAVNIGLSGRLRQGLVRLVLQRADGKLRNDWLQRERRLGAQEDRRANPDTGVRRGAVCAVGQYLAPSLYRKQVKGVLNFPAAVLWNVWIDSASGG